VIAQTDAAGEWSTTGEYGRQDFGTWTVIWTIGGKLASPILQFSVSAPCLTTGLKVINQIGLAASETCDTTEGR
jgi:hypothetical protein